MKSYRKGKLTLRSFKVEPRRCRKLTQNSFEGRARNSVAHAPCLPGNFAST